MRAKSIMMAMTASLLLTATTPVYAMVGSEGQNRTLLQIESSQAIGAGQDAVILPAPYDLKDDTRSNLVQDAPDQPVRSSDMDNNQAEAIASIQDYIKENIDSKIFASLYIDWETQATGTIVLSFTEEVSNDKQADLLVLAGDNNLKFRIVDYNESELRDKQQEIDEQWKALEAEDILVRTTGVNVYTNRVEVGIEPFENQNVARVYELFGNDMVEVVQGYEIQMYTTQIPTDGEAFITTAIDTDDEASEEKMTTTSVTEERKGFFQRIADFFRNLFSRNK